MFCELVRETAIHLLVSIRELFAKRVFCVVERSIGLGLLVLIARKERIKGFVKGLDIATQYLCLANPLQGI